ncbi:PAS domain-containing hybrid sensor histidine kinase/response regulator [Lutibacter flavus]|uniref:histidine kinase n=1 Tax=Lutibacter flavus TaxID=691689 RepID=A0A238YNL9_9FLAO|nr:PAS domain-containing hybrid sensor histidine kinase/response regulator [Lutibacter flavus]SNR72620.1 PAS domain-containing protein [Lutibacter flavus]
MESADLLLNDVNLIVISIDENGSINYVSTATEKIIGYKPKSLLGEQWWKKTFLYEEEGELFKHKVCKIISKEIEISNKPYDRKLQCKDGSVKWIEWRDSLSGNNTFVSVGVDITEWKMTEEIKTQSDAILNSITSMVFVSEKNGNIIYANPAVQEILGYSVEEILGDKWWELTYDNRDEALKVKEATYNYVYNYVKGFLDIFKRKIKTKNGDYKWIEWQISKGINDTYISIGTDITSRIASEIELKKAKETAEKSLKVKNDFLANMSHEIRTPLNAVIGFTDLLLESELKSDQRNHLETMRNSGEILLSLINNVLDLSKLESDKLEIEDIEFNLHKNLFEVVNLMKLKAEEKGITLDLVIEENLPMQVIGDPTRLGQIMLNLIGNAVKFTNEGSVVVRVKVVKKTAKISNIHIEIKDTGIGIVSNKINTVFGVFTQAKSDTSRIYGGTGLGLAIVKKLVKLLKGEIQVESKFGVGSVFTLILPLKKGGEMAKEEELQISTSTSQKLGLNILLVEDNKTNQLLAKTRLERWDCNVDIANNGIEGVKKIQKKLYDIVLMDIQMPVMDGYEATKIIKNDISKKAAAIPIIAMTAYTSKNDIKRALDVGMNDYIFKPFKTEELYALLKKYGKPDKEQSINEVEELTIKPKIEQVRSNIDLKFLREETLNETSILKLLIELFLKDLDEFIGIVDLELVNKNWSELYKATHKIKPSIAMFGISKFEPIIHVLMNIFREEKNLEDVEGLIIKSKVIIANVKNELLTELKLLNDE